jgi:hypothetical protein
VPRRSPVCPDTGFRCCSHAWKCPHVPLRLRALAPRLAPREIVSKANV